MPDSEKEAEKARQIEEATMGIVSHLVERGVDRSTADQFVKRHAKFDSLSDGQLLVVDDKWLGGMTHLREYAERLYSRIPAEEILKGAPSGAYDPVAAGKALAEAQKKLLDTSLSFR